MNFTDLFKKCKNRLELIATFLALLELIRLKEVSVRQRQMFSEIEVVRNADKISPKLRAIAGGGQGPSQSEGEATQSGI